MSPSKNRLHTGALSNSNEAVSQDSTVNPQKTTSTLSRRDVILAGLGFITASAFALSHPLQAFATPSASEETLSALSAAEKAVKETEAKLETISKEFVALSQELDKTIAKIEGVQKKIDAKQAEIDKKQAQIDKKQAELEKKQEQLGDRISQDYKTGSTDFLSVVLNSSSFEALTSNIFYMGKINASDEALINEVKDAKAELEQDKAELVADKEELEAQKAELEELKATQTTQVEAVQAKQQEASDLLASQSAEVQSLIEKRDAEILAAAEEEKRQREAAAKAAAAAQGGTTVDFSNMSEKSAAIVSCTYTVGSPGGGLCAMWVSMVYQAAGLGYPGGNANNMYANFCTSSDKSDLVPGMIIAVSTHSGTVMGQIYGHVGIYIGDGVVRHNIGSIATDSLDDWIAEYGTLVTPRWGWAA